MRKGVKIIIKMLISLIMGLGFSGIGYFMEDKLKIKDVKRFALIFFIYGVICGLLMFKFIC